MTRVVRPARYRPRPHRSNLDNAGLPYASTAREQWAGTVIADGHGRGAHGSMPQAAVDPVVLAAMIVIRLQTVIARELAPTEPAVLTVGSIRAGTKSNVVGDHAVLELNIRSYHDQTRQDILAAVRRIVTAECQASGSPQDPDFELFDRFPPTDNDPAVTARIQPTLDTGTRAMITAALAWLTSAAF